MHICVQIALSNSVKSVLSLTEVNAYSSGNFVIVSVPEPSRGSAWSYVIYAGRRHFAQQRAAAITASKKD